MTPTAARRTSSGSPSASTAQASLDAPPASSTGSPISTLPPSTCVSAAWSASFTVRYSPAVVAAVIPEDVRERRERFRAFMDEHVLPNEAALAREDDADAQIVAAHR